MDLVPTNDAYVFALLGSLIALSVAAGESMATLKITFVSFKPHVSFSDKSFLYF